MELLLTVFVTYVGYVILIGFSKIFRRKSIIKKYFKSIGDEVVNGLRDEELIERSNKGNLSACGLSTPLSNEAASNALDEIKRKGLAHSDEKKGIWLTGGYSLETCSSEEKILTEMVAVRCKQIGVKYLD